MLDFLNESWFWPPLFVTVTALGSLVLQELIRPRSQARIERLKMYDFEILTAHKSLYLFISNMGENFTPPEAPREDFIYVMKTDFYKNVQPNMLLFAPEIRNILVDFDAQYRCLVNQELSTKLTFDEFVDKEIHKVLDSLKTLVEKSVDSALKPLR